MRHWTELADEATHPPQHDGVSLRIQVEPAEPVKKPGCLAILLMPVVRLILAALILTPVLIHSAMGWATFAKELAKIDQGQTGYEARVSK